VDLRELEAGRTFSAEISSLISLDERIAIHGESLLAAVEVDGQLIELSVPLTILIKDRIDVTPSRSVWFPRKETETLKVPGAPLPAKTLELTSIGRPAHRFQITSIKVEKGGFRTRVETVEEGRRYRLTVELERPEGTATRLIRDNLVVETDDPRVPKITIPCTAQL
jgi:hypothetical protein